MYEKQEEFFAWLSEVRPTSSDPHPHPAPAPKRAAAQQHASNYIAPQVKGLPQEACSQRELKEHFTSYVEDFNTATMPDEKYYNLRTWYVKEQARIAKEGTKAKTTHFERTSFDDEGDRMREIRRGQALKSESVAKVMSLNMTADVGLAADMREQQELAQTMRNKMQTGDTEGARELIKKLDPNHVSEEELRAVWGTGGGATKKARKPQKS